LHMLHIFSQHRSRQELKSAENTGTLCSQLISTLVCSDAG